MAEELVNNGFPDKTTKSSKIVSPLHYSQQWTSPRRAVNVDNMNPVHDEELDIVSPLTFDWTFTEASKRGNSSLDDIMCMHRHEKTQQRNSGGELKER